MTNTTATAAAFFDRHRALFEYDTYGGRGTAPTTTAEFVLAMQALVTSSATSSYDHLLAHINNVPSSDMNTASTLKQSCASRVAKVEGSSTNLAPPYVKAQWYTAAQQSMAPLSATVHQTSASVGLPFQSSPTSFNIAARPQGNNIQSALNEQQPPPQRPQQPQKGPLATASVLSASNTVSPSHPQPQYHTHHPQTTSAPLKNTTPLLDSSLRITRGRKIDLAQKIEQLVGPRFGRVIGPSNQNLPPSIKRRLDSYHRLDERKEGLYQLLKAEYIAMQGSRRR
ncbi:hypothetical protein H310_06455 [Aphanomyces invadans]|uniref:Uncharacterized protein n=1 Tax=Aphanomyces invadans TaxID=157072 RepID=A0A024U689_9STRA|nr:hypothetical protein H310_06455 [Aphanomyces invadans]ETW01901.1 hypothetical protein H310_06455 [Aphanomyces invadans]|eukprot:XP_008869749.1 hypothetical protein H310_06455 [Aphanomyces invadans]